MRFLPAVVLLLGASAAMVYAEHARGSNPAGAMGDSSHALRGQRESDTTVPVAVPRGDAPTAVRALYVNRSSVQTSKRMKQIIAIADETEINGLVLDMKDEFGLNYVSKDTLVRRNAGRAGTVPHLRELLDTLRAHGIVSIARLVTFKDSVTARINAQHTIRKPDGTPWRDKQGLTWVDPYDASIWEYNIRVAEELARMGFDEIQFDYIRFPEPYKSLPVQHFSDTKGRSKPQVLQDFLHEACKRINTAGARCTADVFGLVTQMRDPLEIGQQWEKISSAVDVVLPMTYPSHYPRGSFGLVKPNADPERVLQVANAKAHDRDIALGIANTEHVRPWLQAFTLGKPAYGPAELEAQKRGVYAAGYDGWVLWNPGSKYEIYLPALEKTFVSRKLPYPRAAIARAGAQSRDTVTTVSDSLARAMRSASPLADSIARPVNAGAVPSDSGTLVKP
jgi:hypothetical protein